MHYCKYHQSQHPNFHLSSSTRRKYPRLPSTLPSTPSIPGRHIRLPQQMGCGHEGTAERTIFPGAKRSSQEVWGLRENRSILASLSKFPNRSLNDRPGPSELSINNSSAVQALHSSQCKKGTWYDLGGTNVNIHRTRDRKVHDRQRVFWDKAASGTGTFSSYGNSVFVNSE